MTNSHALDLIVVAGAPVTLAVSGVTDATELAAWLTKRRTAVREALRVHGHLLIQGLPIASLADFATCRDALVDAPALYSREETTQRSTYADNVFSATDLPAVQTIRLHNEDSYSVVVPGLLLFCCLVAPDAGGGTTLGDTRRLLQLLPPALVEDFRRRGWLVRRTFTDHVGISWSRAFGTGDRTEVEEYGLQNQVGVAWLADGRLQTSNLRAATVRHPHTGEECWFNHIAVFNEWTHDEETRELLLSAYGADGLPQNTFYGDGTPIEHADVAAINAAYDAVTVTVPWRPGDLLLVDNILSAHGRQPYTGSRHVLVAMGDPVDVRSCAPSSALGPGPLGEGHRTRLEEKA